MDPRRVRIEQGFLFTAMTSPLPSSAYERRWAVPAACCMSAATLSASA